MLMLLGGLAACAGANPSPSASEASTPPLPAPSPGCAPTTSNGIRAVSLSFDRSCLAVPAGSPSTLAFANDDAGESHNVAVYPRDSCLAKAALRGDQPRCADPLGPALFRGPIIVGVDSITYDLPPLAAGRYVFLCEVHPFMHGILRIG
jgi:plastocyanin